MKKEKFLVLDVEGLSDEKPYDIGFIIADRGGKIYKKFSFALVENLAHNYNKSCQMDIARDMTVRNFQAINMDIKQEKWKKVLNETLIEGFERLIKKYNIKKMYAYNVDFDKGALKRLFGERFDNVVGKLEFIDIWRNIILTRCTTKKYLEFCVSNGYMTEKNNFKTSAEVVYRYLFGLNDFEEEHTGLSDVLIEYEILQKAFKSGKKIDKTTKIQTWRHLANFAATINMVY